MPTLKDEWLCPDKGLWGGQWKSESDLIKTICERAFNGAAHPLVFRLIRLLCCPTLRALVPFVARATGLGCSRLVCVALRAGLVGLGGSAVHLQTPQVAALEAALFHDPARPPRVGAIACWLTWNTQHRWTGEGARTPGSDGKSLERTWTCPLSSVLHSSAGHARADIRSLIVYLAQPGDCLAQRYRSKCQRDKMSKVPKVPGAKVAVHKKNWIYLFISLVCRSKLVLDGRLRTWESSRRVRWRLMWDISTVGWAGEHVKEKPKQDDKKLTRVMRTTSQTGGRENGWTWLAQSSRISMETQTIQETRVPSREVAQIHLVAALKRLMGHLQTPSRPRNPPGSGGLRALHLQSPATQPWWAFPFYQIK